MAEKTPASNTSKGGGRSVAYPFTSLETAIQRAQQFWYKEGKNLAPITAAVSHWGYGEKSSGGKQTIAALKQFGLLEDVGSGDKRQVRLTSRALDVILEPIKRAHAIRDAAISPKIYAELLSHWKPDNLPSDATISTYLLREKDFNRYTVDAFIKDFKANIQYAGLTSSDNIPQDTEDDAIENMNYQGNIEGIKPPATKVGRVERIIDPEGLDIVLQFSGEPTYDSYEFLRDYIDLRMKRIKRESDY